MYKYIACFICFFNIALYSQEDSLKNEIYRKAYFYILSDNINSFKIDDLSEIIINNPMTWESFEKTEFENVVFLTLFDIHTISDTLFLKDTIVMFYRPILMYERSYTVAYIKQKPNVVYRISGYRGNDICRFLDEYTKPANFSSINNNRINMDVYEKRKILGKYKIPNVDMDCFWQISKLCKSKIYRQCLSCPENYLEIVW